jgi:hypothetical protein
MPLIQRVAAGRGKVDQVDLRLKALQFLIHRQLSFPLTAFPEERLFDSFLPQLFSAFPFKLLTIKTEKSQRTFTLKLKNSKDEKIFNSKE